MVKRIGFENGIPVYGENAAGYGFVCKNSAMPVRTVELSELFLQDGAVCVCPADRGQFAGYHHNATDYDLGGMILRIDLEPGACRIEVECTGGEEDMLLSVSGNHPDKIRDFAFWDAAELVPNKSRARWEGNVWTFDYVHGRPFIEIEAEPLHPGQSVGIRRVTVTPMEQRQAEKGREKPTIFILGDSTAKSYVFEEAPMSAWGQCFYKMIDSEKARVVNYSNGGRSLKTMHVEGRFNDLLLSGKPGDFVLLQSGHNDERSRNEGADPDGEKIRFGGGSTEEMYYRFLTEMFLPAIRARGMRPVLVTPVTRIDGGCGDDTVFRNSFTNRRFPDVMRRAAQNTGTPLLDLNSKSVEYFNEIGAFAARAVVMAMEAGETPGKTNSGSYANGNPMNHPDGTHYKEALSKQYCRMAAEEIGRLRKECLNAQGESGCLQKDGSASETIAELYELLFPQVKEALQKQDFSDVFPEVCADTKTGSGAYYRNQIEKMVQLGIFQKNTRGCFRPDDPCTVGEFSEGIRRLWRLPVCAADGVTDAADDGTDAADSGMGTARTPITRKTAACILYDAYMRRFGDGEANKPPYMTDYNGISISPNDPNYDANIPIGETIYYPLVPVERICDLDELSEEERHKIQTVYRLGIMRSEAGIERGTLKNGTLFEPETVMSRAKAAKLLYFCFVLDKDVKVENHRVDR